MGLEVESQTARRGVHLTTEITSEISEYINSSKIEGRDCDLPVRFFSTMRSDVVMIVTGSGKTFTTNVTGVWLLAWNE